MLAFRPTEYEGVPALADWRGDGGGRVAAYRMAGGGHELQVEVQHTQIRQIGSPYLTSSQVEKRSFITT
jgi:hypothetical protein